MHHLRVILYLYTIGHLLYILLTWAISHPYTYEYLRTMWDMAVILDMVRFNSWNLKLMSFCM